MRNPSVRALAGGSLAYLVTSMLWGANIPLTAVLFDTFDPFFMLVLRLGIATTVLALCVVLTSGWRSLGISIGIGRMLAMSATMAAFFMSFNLGLLYTNTITAAAIMAGSPVYAVVTMRIVAGTRLESGIGLAAALTLAGAGLAVWSRDDGAGLQLQGGEILLALAISFWTVYSLMAQRWFPPDTAQLRRTWLASLCATIWLIPAWGLVWLAGIIGAPNLSPSPDAVVWLVITAVFSTALGGVLWNLGVAHAGLTAGAFWQNAVPVFGVLIAMLFGFIPTAGQIAGGAIVMAGVLTMQWRRIQRARAMQS